MAIDDKLKQFYDLFNDLSILELQEKIFAATDRAERIFLTKVMDVKLGLAQEVVVGEELF